MSDVHIECPKCHQPFELTEALARPVLDAARRNAVAETEQRLAAEASRIAAEAASAARAESAATIAALQHERDAVKDQVAKAQQAEVTARMAEQEALTARAAMEGEVAHRVAQRTAGIADQARKEAAAQYAAELDTQRRLAEVSKSAVEQALQKARAEQEAAAQELARHREATESQLTQAREAVAAADEARRAAERAKLDVEAEIARRLAEQVSLAADRARQEAGVQYAAELERVQADIAAKDAKLAEAQAAEIAARRAMREAEEVAREAQVVVERRLDEERAKVRELALKERDDEYRLKLHEKERQLSELKAKLDEAQRKADQGSQQIQGDILEVDLHELLREAFPYDQFERVKKGQRGGDIIQTVCTRAGVVCGRIKWESKNTQHWSDAWLPKIREDQRAARCDHAVLMSEALPIGISHFDQVDGVWVTSFETAVPLAAALRRGLIDTSAARRASDSASTSRDLVYGYVMGGSSARVCRGWSNPSSR